MNTKSIKYSQFIGYIRENSLLDNGEDTKTTHIDRVRLMALINLDMLLITFPKDVYGYLRKLLKIAKEEELEEIRLIIAKAKTRNLQLFHKYLLDGANIKEDILIIKNYGYMLDSADSEILESILMKGKVEALEIFRKG